MNTMINTTIQGSYHVSEFSAHLPAEIRRLDAQVDLFWASEREILARFGLQDGMDVLDCGCGPGRLIELLKQEFQNSTFTGLEIDPVLVDVARQKVAAKGQPDCRIIQGSAEQSGLEAESFDFIILRLVLEHLPDPAKGLESLKVLLKPGGRIAIISNDFSYHLRTWPDVRELETLYEAYRKSRRSDGGDPCIGRRLPQLLRNAGFALAGFEIQVSHSQMLGDRPFLQAEGVGIPAQLVASGFLEQQELEQLIHSWTEMLRHPDHCIMRPVVVAIGRLPASDGDQATLVGEENHGEPHVEVDPNYVAPKSELEKKIADIWGQAMQMNRVGVKSNFFDLGGQSLMLEEIQASLASRLDIHLQMAVLFEHPTVEALAQYLKTRSGQNKDSSEQPASLEADDTMPQPDQSRLNQEELERKARKRREAFERKRQTGDRRGIG
jgi:SAM-dependent methyltransferase/acyl carrier protein